MSTPAKVLKPLAVQFSPEEVLGAEGYWSYTPTGYNTYRFPKKLLPFVEGTLELSNARSNGCFLIKNREESAKVWINKAEAVAAKYNADNERKVSARCIRIAGYMMLGQWAMLPTKSISGAGVFATTEDYALTPEVPFNDDEMRTWEQLYRMYNLSQGILAGAEVMAGKVRYQAEGSENLTNVDPNFKHHIFVYPNHAQWVVPLLMSRHNTGSSKNATYFVAMNAAHEVDAGRFKESDIPGYEAPGADKFNWYAANESARKSETKFEAQAEAV